MVVHKKSLKVLDKNVSFFSINSRDYISLNDMLKAKDGNFFISDWLRNRNTIEFLGVWEKIFNSNFNCGEYAIIKSKAGLNSYKLSAKEWINKTNAIGIISKPGRYGGTYAHKDIALEFASWISVEFKLYLIKEFQRLKEQESIDNNIEWNIKRQLTKINYCIHTDAVQKNLIPDKLTSDKINRIYAKEADILNIALFGITAKEWREINKDKKGNIRDFANIVQLVCLSNLENLNALFINEGMKQSDRLVKLNEIAIYQMKILVRNSNLEMLSKKINVNNTMF